MGCCGPKKTTYVCPSCGKEEEKDARQDQEVKSCCGQPMKKSRHKI